MHIATWDPFHAQVFHVHTPLTSCWTMPAEAGSGTAPAPCAGWPLQGENKPPMHAGELDPGTFTSKYYEISDTTNPEVAWNICKARREEWRETFLPRQACSWLVSTLRISLTHAALISGVGACVPQRNARRLGLPFPKHTHFGFLLSEFLRTLLGNESIVCEEGEGSEWWHGPLLWDFTPVQGMI